MDAFLSALFGFFDLKLIFVLFCGVCGGIAVGSIPGLTATMAVAIMTSFTFHMDTVSAIMILIGVYYGGIYGGSISAVLLHIPGTPSAVMTARDGYPMAQRGEGGAAIGIATWASFTGGMLGIVLLILCAPLISRFALRFSAPEYFALSVFGLSIVASISERSLARGLIGVLLGLLICVVGTDPVTGMDRFTFGVSDLYSGFQFVPVMIGLFGFSEILDQLSSRGNTFVPQKLTNLLPSWKLIRRLCPTILRGSLIGVGIGALPGTGGAIASFVAYNSSRNSSKTPEAFGTGIPEGIAAPESANNASCGGALMPMLTLGVPGDAITAILIGAFILHNVQPGPMLFTSHPDVVYSVYIGSIIANCFMALIGFVAAGFFARLISFPFYILLPVILMLCMVGSFAVNNNIFDVYVMLGFGVFGYLLNKLGIPLTPLVLGVVLGPILEDNLRTTITMSHGEWSYFFTRPIAMFFIIITILSVGFQQWKVRRQKTGNVSA